MPDPFDSLAEFRAQFREYNRAAEMGGWFADLLQALKDQQAAVAGSFRSSIQEALNFSMEGALQKTGFAENPVFTELFVSLSRAQKQVIEQWRQGSQTFQTQQEKVAREMTAALTRNLNYRW